MGMITVEANRQANVDAADPKGEFEENPFRKAVSLQLKDGKSPAGVAGAVAECIAMAKRLGTAFDISDAAAIKFGLYPRARRRRRR